MKLSFFILFFLSLFFHFQSLATPSEFLIGYSEEEDFVPLLAVMGESLKKLETLPQAPYKKIRDAFQNSTESYQIKKWEINIDDMSGDSYVLAKLDRKIVKPKRGTFFISCIGVCKQPEVKNQSSEILNSFYSFFAKDKWGKHFIPTDLLKKSTAEIAAKSEVHIHHLTDLNKNGLPELWITYRLMHGEIGHMVYEQGSKKATDWKMLTNGCIGCD